MMTEPLQILETKNQINENFAKKQKKVVLRQNKNVVLKWQVFFIPIIEQQSDPNNQTTKFFAFCPFTKIGVPGQSIEEASYHWVVSAREKFGSRFSFCLPKYLTTSQRKVWFGRNNNQNAISASLNPPLVYIWNVPASGDSIESGVAFCPETGEIGMGSFENWKIDADPNLKFIPTFWFEENLQCTPIMKSMEIVEDEINCSTETESDNGSPNSYNSLISPDSPNSLTPQYIN